MVIEKKAAPMELKFSNCPLCEKEPINQDPNSSFVHCTNEDCVMFDVDVDKGLWGGSLIRGRRRTRRVSMKTEEKFMHPTEAV